MKSIGIVFLLILSFSVLAQPNTSGEDKIETTLVNGEECVVHVVEQGNTLYSLHRQYEVSIDEIVALNPTAKEALQVGQVVYIPIANSNIEKYKTHVVEAKQTLYGISRIYNVEVSDLLKLNPEAKNGLQIGQQIKVPLTNTVQENPVRVNEVPDHTDINKEDAEFRNPVNGPQLPDDSTEVHTVQNGETLYSIARAHHVTLLELIKLNNIKNGEIRVGQNLRIPSHDHGDEAILPILPFVSDTNYTAPVFAMKPSYKVAVILPLNVQKNQEVLSGMITQQTELNRYTDLSLDFYMGAQMALDSLEKLGLIAEVTFYDSKANASEVSKIIASGDFQHTDIVIGPLFDQTIKPVAAWVKQNGARLIVPFKASTNILKNNPYTSFAVPSKLTLIKSLAHYYALEHGKDNVVLVKSNLSNDDNAYRVFREEFNSLTTNSSYRGVLKEIYLTDSGDQLSKAVDPDTITVFVDLSSDLSHAMRFLTVLNRVKNQRGKENAEIIAVGLDDWMKFDDLSNYYKNRFQLHFASAYDLNYHQENTEEFVLSFRSKFNADPSKYAIQGFDVTFAYLNQYLLQRNVSHGVMNDIRLESRGAGNGTENGTCFILKQENFEIKRVGKVINQRVY